MEVRPFRVPKPDIFCHFDLFEENLSQFLTKTADLLVEYDHTTRSLDLAVKVSRLCRDGSSQNQKSGDPLSSRHRA